MSSNLNINELSPQSFSIFIFIFSHLHLVNDVQEELMGILLSVGGELGVSPADQSLEHAWRDPLLLVLEQTDWLYMMVVSRQVTNSTLNYQLTSDYCLAMDLM